MDDTVMILNFLEFDNSCCAQAFFCGLVAITRGITVFDVGGDCAFTVSL